MMLNKTKVERQLLEPLTFTYFPAPPLPLTIFSRVICGDLNKMSPSALVFEQLIHIWWYYLEDLGGVSLLEERCHWGRALRPRHLQFVLSASC